MNFLKSAERFGKKALTFFLNMFIKQESIPVDAIDSSKIDKVLIVRQDRRIGNLILSTPLFKKIKTILPNAGIDILIAESNEPLCENNPYLNNIYTFDHKGFIKNPFRFLKMISTLGKNKYSLVIESSNPSGASFLNGYITYLTKSPLRVGFDRGRGSIFTNVHINPDHTKHYYIIQQDLVSFLSNDKIYFKPEIFSNEAEIKRTKDLLNEKFNLNVENKIIGIWIGARGKKKWHIENFKKLYNRISTETNYFPVMTFGIEEQEDFRNIDSTKYNSLLIVDLKKLKSFISTCNVFICGDTGPLHFSFALGTPTIGVFLEENYIKYGYADGDKNFIIKPAVADKMIEQIILILSTILN